MNRRAFIQSVLAAPAVILTPGLLMPVRAWQADVDEIRILFSGGKLESGAWRIYGSIPTSARYAVLQYGAMSHESP